MQVFLYEQATSAPRATRRAAPPAPAAREFALNAPAGRDLAAPEDLAACHAMMRGGSRSFFAASLFLPRAVCQPAAALYAFCRMADDEVDVAGGGVVALARLRERLDRVYAGRPLPIPGDRALADVAHRFGMPRALPDALLEGFEWDALGRRYEDLPDLYDYAARVAGTVGAMMAMLMGAREAAVVARACDLGVAMQLSNIARDVGEDARAGRLYLPLRWLREAGIDPDAFLAHPAFTPALGSVVRRLLAAADALYARAEAGIAHLPSCCRPGIRAARLLYAEIGREVERRGCDSVASRAVVPGRRKMALLTRAFAPASLPGDLIAAPPLRAVAHLVDAVVAARPGATAAPRRPLISLPRLGVDERMGWVIDLFDRLEQREQMMSRPMMSRIRA
jgi:phytoene synthase